MTIPESVPDPFRILVVCTGNICRSPAAQLLLARDLGPSVTVESGGTGAVVGRGVHPLMADLLAKDGVDSSGFRARAVTEAIIRNADLVLVMTREHRASVVELAPAAVRRTFTLQEFVRLLAVVDPEGSRPSEVPAAWLPRLVPAAAAARSHLRLGSGDHDIEDPIGLDEATFARVYRTLRDASRSINSSL